MNTFTRSLLVCFLLFCCIRSGADSIPHKKRLKIVGLSSAAVYGGSLLVLNQAWYANYPRSSFHWINDNAEWLQMDKCGHLLASYSYGIAGIDLMKWTGMERKKAIWIGGMMGTIFQTPIEILDGFSAQWGASAGDLLANSLGTALVISQELAWDEQRFQPKFSYSPGPYASYRPGLLGNSWYSSILKDYNAQTYWLSVNLSSFFKNAPLPKWLNLSFGYGAEGMLGGTQNTWTDATTGIKKDYSEIERYRQFLVSADIDMTKIPVKSPVLKKMFRYMNIIKIPAPAYEFGSNGKSRFYWIYF
jgi:hypothetical protein